MKIQINSYELLKALKTVKQVVNTKATIQIYSCVFFDIKNGLLTLKGADQEIYLTYEMSLDVSNGSGTYAVDPVVLINFLGTLENQQLTIEFNDFVVITTEIGVYTIPFNTNNEKDIPQPAKMKEVLKATISSDSLLVGLNKTIYATSQDMLRPQMAGVLVELNDKVNFVSSNSQILANYTSTTKDKVDTSFIIPTKAANIIKTLLSEHCNVTIEISDTDKKVALFKINDYRVYANVLDGNQFPNYKAIIPSHQNYLIVNKRELLSSLKRVSLFTNTESGLVKFSIDHDRVKLTAQDIDFGVAGMEQINCVYEGDKLDIGFKSILMVEVLNSIATDDVKLELGAFNQACLVKPVKSDVNEFVLIMPMMIN